ncbi:MAG: PDZ domain-containing protein [Kofleriaceae bacterium]|nr:PDZ domain-containing protein [Kofleriaceae bacterium]MBP9165982.1 PDZ domain-containing protein [Kofleriaceae bacterium]MBP9857339.1 PDZ domain-containing protein [Kofleriaceae bacterium]
MARLLAAIALTTLACREPRPAPRPIAVLPSDADAAIAIDVVAIRDTWLATALVALARRLELPDCVVARARAATAVAIAWSEQLPRDGWLVVLTGGDGPPCPALLERDGLATWHRELPPRADDDPGYFADRERRARLARRRDAPVQAIADHEVSPGIAVAADLGLDPRDGVVARAGLRFATGGAADGARARLGRWRSDLDPTRLGGAAAALDALTIAGPVAGTPAIELRLELPGPDGAAAGAALVTALTTGAAFESRAPCPAPTALATFGLGCASEIVVPRAAQAALAAAPRAAPLRPGPTGGRPTLAEVAPGSALAALGLLAGDTIVAIDGATAGPDWAAVLVDGLATGAPGTTAAVRIRRTGRELTLRYRIAP